MLVLGKEKHHFVLLQWSEACFNDVQLGGNTGAYRSISLHSSIPIERIIQSAANHLRKNLIQIDGDAF